jgi:hypothetical protein
MTPPNEARAERARQALAPYLEKEDGDAKTAIVDLLADLYHFADSVEDGEDWGLSDLLAVAADHYDEEVIEEEELGK